MLTNVFSYVLDALNYQGIAIVAWVGVALAHVAYLRRTKQRRRRRSSSAPAGSRPSTPAASRPGSRRPPSA